MSEKDEQKWEYGWYDTDSFPHAGPFWVVFGILNYPTPEAAQHTADKCRTGDAVIVRRRVGATDWEVYDPCHGCRSGEAHMCGHHATDSDEVARIARVDAANRRTAERLARTYPHPSEPDPGA